MSLTRGVPSLDIDLYAADVLEDSRPVFAQIRAAGPVVWLPRHRMWAMGGFDDVRAALRDDELFTSGDGVAANPIANRAGRKTTLSSDGETHAVRRKVMMRSLGAKAIKPIEGRIASEADRIVSELANGEEFSAVADFARGLPVRVVADLVGVRVDSEQMLRSAAATFEALGPLNRRGVVASRRSLGLLLLHAAAVALTRRFRAAGRRAVSTPPSAARSPRPRPARCWSSTSSPRVSTQPSSRALTCYGCSGPIPKPGSASAKQPDLIPAAVVEAVRLASPIRGFTRRLARDTEIDGVPMKRGSRVVLLFGAANLDERHFPDPERFDLDRPQAGHLGWGNGPHTCVRPPPGQARDRAL